jgi:hypothetical protein
MAWLAADLARAVGDEAAVRLDHGVIPIPQAMGVTLVGAGVVAEMKSRPTDYTIYISACRKATLLPRLVYTPFTSQPENPLGR